MTFHVILHTSSLKQGDTQNSVPYLLVVKNKSTKIIQNLDISFLAMLTLSKI